MGTQTWISADFHAFHSNIIRYCNRPFKNTEEMNETTVANWNSVVRPEDTAWFLGDFGFVRGSREFKRKQLLSFRNRLNGHIYFVQGNHDKDTYLIKDTFKIWVPFGIDITINGQPVTLCHYAMRTWAKSHFGAYQLYGHSHGTLPDNPSSLSMDVGVDANNFFPISFEQVKAKMATKTFKPVDGHGKARE